MSIWLVSINQENGQQNLQNTDILFQISVTAWTYKESHWVTPKCCLLKSEKPDFYYNNFKFLLPHRLSYLNHQFIYYVVCR